MKKVSVVLLGAFLLLLTSCMPVMKVFFGIKSPRIENEASIKEYALKTGLDTSSLCTVGQDYFLKVISQRGFPEGLIFDHLGRYIEYKRADTSCNAGLFGFLEQLHPGMPHQDLSLFNYHEQMSTLRTLKGEPFYQSDSGNYDFVVLIYWVKWEGKANKDHVQEWQNLAKQNKNARIKVILVNLDVQEYYDQESQQTYIKAIRKALNHVTFTDVWS